MGKDKFRIGVVAPASRIDEALAKRLARFVAGVCPGVDLHIHPQCFLSSGHFAGDDAARAGAFLDIANDAGFDALWWARGGYGANRIAPLVLPHLRDAAKMKTYLGYSDAGFLLAGLYTAGFAQLAHGPVAADIKRNGGEAAITRALSFLTARDTATLEPNISAQTPTAAFNLTVLSHLIGTELEPDLTGHVLMLEEVSEHLYAFDRAMFHVTAAPGIRKVAGIRLGRFSDVLPNDVDFGQTAEDIVRHWCAISQIPYLGRADIGHDADNKVVPFGRWPLSRNGPNT